MLQTFMRDSSGWAQVKRMFPALDMEGLQVTVTTLARECEAAKLIIQQPVDDTPTPAQRCHIDHARFQATIALKDDTPGHGPSNTHSPNAAWPEVTRTRTRTLHLGTEWLPEHCGLWSMDALRQYQRVPASVNDEPQP